MITIAPDPMNVDLRQWEAYIYADENDRTAETW